MFKNKQSFFSILALILAIYFAPTALAKEKIEFEQTNYGRTEAKIIKVTSLANPLAQKYINSTIQAEALDFAKGVQDEYYTSNIGSKVMYQQNNLLSIYLLEYVYSEGAAHGMSFAKTFTFNLKTGDLYQLQELFQNGSDYQNKINTFIRNDIQKRDIYLFEEFSGIDTEQEFYLKDNALVVYYQIYRYTPYAEGFLEFEIPYHQLNDIFAADFKLLN
ncbi:MAG: DUF3298 and DUF4163 domain-containing protein [Sporomusaceae bacterium]|nr:DUF3298 and DUF4163 domain-containing protein [Sporomusaceae bacterium]